MPGTASDVCFDDFCVTRQSLLAAAAKAYLPWTGFCRLRNPFLPARLPVVSSNFLRQMARLKSADHELAASQQSATSASSVRFAFRRGQKGNSGGWLPHAAKNYPNSSNRTLFAT
jgi:hypothetical protein